MRDPGNEFGSKQEIALSDMSVSRGFIFCVLLTIEAFKASFMTQLFLFSSITEQMQSMVNSE